MVKKVHGVDFNKLTNEEKADFRKELDRIGFNEYLIKAYENYVSPFGMRLEPKDSSDRLLHYNLERLSKGKNIRVDEEYIEYSKEHKIDPGSKYIMPFYDTIILGTDTAATLGMGFPIPRIFEEYIMNAKHILKTGEDTDAAKNAAFMTIESKKVYVHDIGMDHGFYDHQIKKGISLVADIFLKDYNRHDWQCEDVHLMTIKQMCKALIMDVPILTTQLYNDMYKGIGKYYENVTLPHYYDVMEYMWDTPKHNSVEHMNQIEKVLTKLESGENVFCKISREQDFPLEVENHVSIEEYNKRDLQYILNN